MFFDWLIKKFEKDEFQLMLENEKLKIDTVEERIEATELFEWFKRRKTCFRDTMFIDLKFFSEICTSSESESQVFYQWKD